MNLLQQLEKLRNCSGNQQLDLLKSFKHNQLLKEILYYTYNPHLKFKIAEKGYNKVVWKRTINNPRKRLEYNWNEYKEILNKLGEQKGSTNGDIQEIQRFLDDFYLEDRKFMLQILFKDLRLGMGKTSINKVWKDSIPTSMDLTEKFVVTRLSNYDKNGDKVPFQSTYVGRKFDGINVTVTKPNDKLLLIGRSGKLIPEDRYINIRQQLEKLPVDRLVFCGEIVWIDENTGIDDQHKTSTEEFFEECSFVIFDMLDQEEFFKQECGRNFIHRIEDIDTELDVNGDIKSGLGFLTDMYMVTSYPRIKIAENMKCNDERYKELVKLCHKEGWEGLILRDGSKPYEYKRTKNILRYKPRHDSEFRIKGFEEGKGKYENNLGKIVIKLDDDNEVRVGTGFDDYTRNQIWAKQEQLLERKDLLVKVSYRKLSTNNKGGKSLTEPAFKGFRTKDLVDVSIDSI